MTYFPRDLEAVRQECRSLVRKRALISAGAAVVPVPLMDVVVDAGILMQLIPEISLRFGLAQNNIDAMEPKYQTHVWSIIRKRGSQLIGIVVTRELVRRSFGNYVGRLASTQVAKFIPFGGQLVAAGLSYFVMRQIAYDHIEDCFAVARSAQTELN